MVSRYNHSRKKLMFEFIYIEHSAVNLFFNNSIELTDVEIGYCGYPPQVMTTLRMDQYSSTF